MRTANLFPAVIAAILLVHSAHAQVNPLGIAAQHTRKAPANPAALFNTSTLWTLHLKLTPAEWNNMQPAGSDVQRIGTSAMIDALAAAMLRSGDADRDGALTGDEFNNLADAWFKDWDLRKTGRLGPVQIRTGISLATGLTDSRLQGPPGRRNGLSSAAGIEFNYARADLEFEGQTIKNVGLRYKGNGTWMNSQGTSKHSLKIDFDHFVPNQSFAGINKLNLHNNIVDPGFMNEVLSYQLYRDAGLAAPRTAYARVYVTVPGRYDRRYFGLYSIVESVDKRFEREVLKTTGGALFKPVTPDLFGYMGEDFAMYKQTYDPKFDLSAAQSRRLIDFARVVWRADDKEFAAKVGDYLDLDQFARYMSVTVWLSTLDGILAMGQNFYIYLDPRTGKFTFIPWDLDHSFGQFTLGGGEDEREQLSILHPWKGENRFLERIYKLDAFKKIYLEHFRQYEKSLFTPRRIHKQVDELAKILRPAVREESRELLGAFDDIVAAAGEGGNGRSGRDIEGKPIKPFVIARAASVKAQLEGKSKGMILADSGRNPYGGPGARLASHFKAAIDGDDDSGISREEFSRTFARWFKAWDRENTGKLSADRLKDGIMRDLFHLRPRPRQASAPPRTAK